MPTHEERNRATRDALIEAARALFAEHGYGGASVAVVAERAGVTTGAIYHQFGSKAGLFRAVYSELVERVALRVLEARESVGQPTLLGDCEAYMAACADPAFDRITVDGPAVIGWDQILDEAQALITSSLMDARVRGELIETPIAPLARMLAAALKEAAVIIATADDPAAARTEATDSARMLLSGLTTDGPRG